ncbi:MAG: secretin N-terminal domain-containing protein [Propionivibrio sp.]|uniref:type II secretion system protein GspD n=1 Tax=Propionivibrio sp. TaxID=2212460 RepID=UPI001B4A106D|nr:secretin N-terminal domain-containing protein [Propionivibrio sp.]MBP7202429.1 secretin N-terminal domain-containing protein [Propionivibrio sp.]
MLRIVGAAITVLLLTACAPTTLNGGPSAGHLQSSDAVKAPGSIPQTLQQSVPLPRPKATAKTETYSVVVNNVKVQDLLFALARDAKLNVDIHPGITGSVTLNAIDQTLPQLLTRISKQVDMRFELDGPNLAVMPDTPYLKNYQIDYINIARDVTGTVSTNTQISTSAVSNSNSGGVGGGNTSRIQIENKSKNRFWESLEKNIQDILQDTDKERILSRRTADSSASTASTGNANAEASSSQSSTTRKTDTQTTERSQSKNTEANVSSQTRAKVDSSGEFKNYETVFASSVIVNAETGVISVRATSRQQGKVQEFLDRVMRSAKRQVLIEATIIEVNLNDNYQQGIDWTKAATQTGFSLTRASNTQNVTAATNPFSLVYRNIPGGLNIVVDMLRGFGTTKVLSSPKLTVLNNQTATLKVSEDFVYFNVKQDVVAGSTSGTLSTTSTTTTPQSVSIGFFMSLTAQISDNGTVTLNVRPSISSISDLKRDPNPALTIANMVPQIRTREIESMLRVQSGDIAVLGGLMEDRMDNKSGRFPGAGDIPLLGEIFTTRSNAASKTELVVVLRPTVINDASIDGDFRDYASSLPDHDFFQTDKVYVPFSGPNAMQEPLK